MHHTYPRTYQLLFNFVADGEPSDSPKDKIVEVVRACSKKVAGQGLGPHAVAFQFAQVRTVC